MPSFVSRRLLSRRELRFATGGALSVAAAGLLGAALWLSPWSPSALDRAADLAARGDTDAAIQVYLEVAHGPGFASTCKQALWQAAWLASVDTDAPQRGVELLRDFTARYPADPLAAQAWDRLGTMYSLYQGDAVRAAEAWEQAAAVSPALPDAGRWLVDAGLAYADAALVERADRALSTATAYPDHAVAAHLALGRLHLASDPATAYDHYGAALGLARTEEDASLARLGVASALESLDRVDQALAELEGGDQDDAALNRRRARLQARERR